MNDITIRVLIAVIAGLTYLGGHVPDDMAISELGDLSARVWILFLVNVGTGFISPSIARKALEKAGGK